MMPIPQNIQDAADEAFRSFCEGGLPESHPFQHAWDRHESHHGDIEDGMPLYSFIQSAILYGAQWQQMSAANRLHDSMRHGVPQKYLDRCDCHHWTAAIKDHVFQHKPSCPNFNLEYELAILAKHRHEETMRKLSELCGDKDD